MQQLPQGMEGRLNEVGQRIVDAQGGVDRPVADGVVGRTFLEVALHHAVVLGGTAFGHFVVGDVGNLAEQTHHFLLGLLHGLLQLLGLFLQAGDALLDGFGLFAVAFLHHAANQARLLFLFVQVLV